VADDADLAVGNGRNRANVAHGTGAVLLQIREQHTDAIYTPGEAVRLAFNLVRQAIYAWREARKFRRAARQVIGDWRV